MERRCIRADLILAYTILKGDIDKSPPGYFLLPPRLGLSRHTYRTLQRTNRLQRRSSVFSVLYVKRVVGVSGHETHCSFHAYNFCWAPNDLLKILPFDQGSSRFSRLFQPSHAFYNLTSFFIPFCPLGFSLSIKLITKRW